MNLVVQRIRPLLPMVLSDLVISLIQMRNLLPGTLPKNKMSCIILRTSGPFHSVLVYLFPKDVVTQIVRDGLRWHDRRGEERDRWIPSRSNSKGSATSPRFQGQLQPDIIFGNITIMNGITRDLFLFVITRWYCNQAFKL